MKNDIPIVINNRNRLTSTKKMVEHLLRLNPEQEIIIIDNGSTYEPLLEWYADMMGKITIRFEHNHGHTALWTLEMNHELPDYFIYTDSDIELNENLPKDFIQVMQNHMDFYGSQKVALGLKIDDLPDHYRYKQQVIRNESRWWLPENKKTNYLGYDCYNADTDTTFALYLNIGDNTYKSIRITDSRFIARHLPWYDDLSNLNEEERYYLDNLGDTLTQYSKQHKSPQDFLDI